MRVAVYYNNSDVRVEQQEQPEIAVDELKVKVHSSGICGSDVMEWYRIKTAPRILGHEITGEVCEVGAKVEGYKVGERIFVSHHVPCNTCSYCISGHFTACETLHTTNYDPGGFAEYLRVPSINVDRGIIRLADEVSYDTGTFIEPLACIVRGYGLAGVRPGNRVMVIGAGISGLLFIKLAKAMGAGSISAVDINPYRLAKAKEYGADRVFNALEFTGEPEIADNVIICTGVPQAVQTAINSIDRGGRILFFAVAEPGVDIPVPINQLWRNEIGLQTSYGASPSDLAVASELIRMKRVKVDDMITQRLPMEKVAEGFRLVADAKESLKVVIHPNE